MLTEKSLPQIGSAQTKPTGKSVRRKWAGTGPKATSSSLSSLEVH